MSLDEAQPRSVWARPRFVIPAVLVLVVIIAGILLAVLPDKSDTAADPQPNGSGHTSTTASAPTSDSVCGLEAGSQDIPTSPIAAEWAVVGRMAIPSSTSLGPGVRAAGGWRACYAHSPSGAVMAIANMMRAGTTAETIRRQAREYIVDSPEKDTTVAAQAAASDEDLTATNKNEKGLQIAGFRITSAEPDRVTLDLLVRDGAGGLVAAPRTVVWKDGDWRAELPKDFVGLEGSAVSGTTGFVLWGGV